MNTVSIARIRILSVDDHPLLRQGIAAIIAGQPDMELVGAASSGQEAIETFKRLHPDVTLMDLRMPDMNGIQAISTLRAEFPGARFIVLTTYPGDAQALAALKAGASGYLLKTTPGAELLDVIRAVHAGKRRIPHEIAAEIGQHAVDEALTAREIEVLRLAADGQSNRLIAAELGLSENTVKSHIATILEKLHATDRTHALKIALKRGILDL